MKCTASCLSSMQSRPFSLLLIWIAVLAWPDARAASNGFLYVLDDVSAGANQIVGFSVNEQTGALTAIPGSPFATGGNGDGSTVSERLTVDRGNKRLYAINGASNTLSAFAINPGTGALTALPFSPVALGAGSWFHVEVHPSGSPVIVGDSGGKLASFVITSTTATAAAGSPFATGTSPFSASLSQDGAFIYSGGNSGNTFAGFSVNATTGVLTALAGSPFDTGNVNPIAFATDAAGRVFLANFSANQLRVFTTIAGVPAAAAGNPFVSGLTNAIQSVMHPNGFYMIADRGSSQVGVYQVAGSGSATTLTAAAGSPFASGGTFTDALALNLSGTFLFAANGNTRNLTTFAVNTSTGVLSSPSTQAANTLGATGRITGMAYASVFAANILVFTEPGGIFSAPLITALQNLGNTVTTVDSNTFPLDLSSFDTIWGCQFQTPLSAGQKAVLAIFVQSGKGLFLTGENTGFVSGNAADSALINSLVTGGGVTVGAASEAGAPYPFNPTAVGGVTTMPNAIASLPILAASTITGVAGSNVLVKDKSNNTVGAVWGPSNMANGRGKVVIITDVNWYGSNIAMPDSASTVQNLEAFLEGADVGVKMSAPSSAVPLTNLTYTVTVTSTGVVAVANVILTDVIPAGAAFVSANFSQGTTSFSNGIVTANLGTINGGASVTGTIVITPNTGTVANTVSVATTTRDIDAGNNTATVTITNTPPAFASAPAAVPNPAGVGQTIQFTAATIDPDVGQTLSFTWAFGDGSNGSGATPTHAYAAPGTYPVMVTISDGTNTAMASVSVTVNTPLVGTGVDSDGDGFSDSFEMAVGTDPTSATSTPTGAPATAGSAMKLSLVKPGIKLNFAKANSDSIAFSGVVIVTDGFNPNGAKVYFDVGGVIKSFTLASGGAKTGGDSVKFAIKTTGGVATLQTSKFTAKFQKGAFAATLATAGLTNASVPSTPVMVVFTMIFNNTVLQKTQQMSYSAKAGKSGSAK